MRCASLGDVSRLAEIEVLARRTALKGLVDDTSLFSDLTVMKRAMELMASGALENVYVDEFSGLIRGYARLGWEGDMMQIEELWSDPLLDSDASARRMLSFCLGIAKARQAGQVYIWVPQEMSRAEDFLNGYGFHPDGVADCGREPPLMRFVWLGR